MDAMCGDRIGTRKAQKSIAAQMLVHIRSLMHPLKSYKQCHKKAQALALKCMHSVANC